MKFIEHIFVSVCAFVLSAYSPGTPMQLHAENQYLLLPSRYRDIIWKIHATGKIDSFKLSFDHGSVEGVGIGSTWPAPSPNRAMLAYIDSSYNLWLHELSNGRSRRVTSVGQREDGEFAAVMVLITGWSMNNQQILYHVLHSEPHCDDCNRPDLKIRDVAYGFYIYDLKSGEHHTIQMPAEYREWLNGEELLLKSYDAGVSALLRFSPLDKRSSVIATLPGDIHPGAVTSDGNWLVAILHTWSEGRSQSRIIKMDLNSGRIINVTPIGSFAEYQVPNFSPNGQHLAYTRMEMLPDKRARHTIIFDGAPLFGGDSFPIRLPKMHWIDDANMAIIFNDEIIVMNVETKKEKARKRL